MPESPAPPTVVIIGAGFSGAVTAAQLLRRANRPLRVVLVNESGRMARGLAYGTSSLHHVLNVPAGNMSALPEDPDDFLRYCRWVNQGWHAGSFVPRRIYGAYLESLLAAAESAAEPLHAVFEQVVGRVVRVRPPGGGHAARVELDDGRRITADRVVLAFGHFAPAHPLPETARAALGAAYIADPWRQPPERRAAADDVVLLVGAGLTALDMLISLERAGHRGPVLALSRRGLRPQGHRPQHRRPQPPDAAALLRRMGPTLRGQVRELRRTVAAAVARGEDWRDWIGALRPHTPGWWQTLGETDRRRFLRHLQVHWDTLRHRCAPQAHACFERLLGEGRLRLLAGRIVGARAHGHRFVVQVRPRGGAEPVDLTVDLVVNCTAPGGQLERSGSELVQALLDAGHLVPDPLGLGLQVGRAFGVLDRSGQEQRWLRYIGPLLKARDWEATAIPELRQHAAALAQGLLDELAQQPPAADAATSS